MTDGAHTIRLPDGTRHALDYVFGDSYEDVVSTILPVVASSLDAPLRTVEQSLTALLQNASGGYPVHADVRRALHILAANRLSLKLGRAVGPFSEMRNAEWVPITLVDARKVGRRGAGGSVPWLIRGYCLGGQPATELFWRRIDVSSSLLWFLRYTAFGLPKKKAVSTGMSDFPGMRTWVYIPAGSRLVFDRVEANQSFSAYNRALLKARMEDPCPFGYDPPICKQCDVGIHTCYRSTHYDTFATGTCIRCGDVSCFEYKDDQTTTPCVTCRWR